MPGMYIHSARILQMARDARDRAFVDRARNTDRLLSTQNDAIVAIILAASSTEAFINELGEMICLCSDSVRLPPDPLRSKLISLGTALQEIEASHGQLTLKFHIAAQILSGSAFDKGKQPFQDFVTLKRLRDALMHAKPLDNFEPDSNGTIRSTPPRFIQELQKRGIAQDPQNVGMSWFDSIQTPELAQWACETALSMILAVLAMVPDCDGANPQLDPTLLFKGHFRNLPPYTQTGAINAG